MQKKYVVLLSRQERQILPDVIRQRGNRRRALRIDRCDCFAGASC
jgi:hypothetical protein